MAHCRAKNHTAWKGPVNARSGWHSSPSVFSHGGMKRVREVTKDFKLSEKLSAPAVISSHSQGVHVT